MKAEAKAEGISGSNKTKKSHSATGKPRGRPKGRKKGSDRDVEQATEIDRTTTRTMERQIELAEPFPFLQRPDWVRHNVLAESGFDKRTVCCDKPVAGGVL